MRWKSCVSPWAFCFISNLFFFWERFFSIGIYTNIFFVSAAVTKNKIGKTKFFSSSFIFIFSFLLFDCSIGFGGEREAPSCHLVTVDHVQSPVAVPDRLGFASAVVAVTDARGRTSSIVSATALWVHQECGGRLRDHLARLAPATSFELS